jgi:tetratricopeptide (TPR) repeat protein
MSTLANDLKRLLDNGDIAKVRKAFKDIRRSSLKRGERLEIASLARRAGLPQLTVSFLNSLVRPPRHGDTATEVEKAVYAGALVKLGAVEEALDILARIPPDNTPEKFYFEAHALMSQWEYGLAIVSLKKYLGFPSLTDAQRTSGLLNLAASLIPEGDYEEAAPILSSLEKVTAERGQHILLANTLELSAQMAIAEKKWSHAKDSLDRASQILKETKSLDNFFVKKWLTVLAIKRDGVFANLRQTMLSLRAEAMSLKHWESVRDCDLILSTSLKDEYLFHQVYFGTNFEAFRKMALLRYPDRITIPEEFAWKLGEVNEQTPVIRCSELLSRTEGRFGPAGVPVRLFTLLVSDFFRPFRVATVFGSLAPKEYFNPITSPGRVHQSVAVLKRWLKERRLPLKVSSTSDGYRLEAFPACQIIVPLRRRELDIDSRMKILRSQFSERAFSARDVSVHLKCSPRTATRLLQRAIGEGTVVCEGRASGTRYSFVESLPVKRRA